MTQVPNLLLESLIRERRGEPRGRDGASGTGGPEADCAGAYEPGLESARSPLAGRPADKFLERPAECGFGFVADIVGDGGNLDTGIRKSLGGNLHSPLGEVLDRRTAHDLGKAIGQRRA